MNFLYMFNRKLQVFGEDTLQDVLNATFNTDLKVYNYEYFNECRQNNKDVLKLP